MNISCIRGSYVISVDFYLELYGIEQHIQRCLGPARDSPSTAPVTCTHVGARRAIPISAQRAGC